MGNKRKAPSDIDKYSDASSGYFSSLDQTDFEDVGPTTTATRSMQTAPQVPFIPGSHTGVSPMIIMNNLVLQQPNSETPALKPWSLTPSIDVVPQSQLLFLQTIMPTGDCTSQSSGKPKHSKKYASMQNTYTKIAPHPAHGSPVDLGPGIINKKSNHIGRHQHRHHDDKPLHSLKQNEAFKGYGVLPNDASWGEFNPTVADLVAEDSLSRLSDPQEPHTTTSPYSLCSDSVTTAYPQNCSKAAVAQSSDVENIPEALTPSLSKRKRFCNTYNILNRSGLLGITLRTKELIRQNKRSQAQLQSLQAQTDLFLEAICSGDPKVWTRLQFTLQNSGDCEENAVESERSVEPDITDVGCMI